MAYGRYAVEWDPRAEVELDELRAFEARSIMRAVDELHDQAETETRNRKPLAEVVTEVPQASWEIRVGDHRVFYEVKEGQTVRILRVILQGRRTTRDALSRSGS
jgi:mRNA-degrading endonuclease RelE of RelBE toxin-antitoxin system